MNTCPYCKSERTQGVSEPKTVLGETSWDLEQLTACVNCKKEFITTYTFSGNFPLVLSTVFEAGKP